jgi:pyruvate dehydrogenase E1 component alpha subunit
MFKEFDPIKKKIFRVMDNDGKVINKKYFPELSDEEVIKAYKDMLFERTADLMTVGFQRQGRIYTYPPNIGQEGIHIATGMVMKEDDWLAPAFRELGVWLAKGATLQDIFMYFMGYEDGSIMKGAKNTLPMSVPIASQLLHATGIAYQIKYRNTGQVAWTFVGDGGTSEGDFHEAVNFAGAWNVPVVFIVQNNQYGISTPFKVQTASEGIAIKSYAYGVQGIQVDGNDVFAMKAALEKAAEHARTGQGPVLVEAVTYRKGAHTTSDDPTKYRTKEEENEWDLTDPLKRLKAYIDDKGLLKDFDEEALVKEYKAEITRQFEAAENYGDYPLEDVFKYLYAEMPEDLVQQQQEHENFLKWKEARS